MPRECSFAWVNFIVKTVQVNMFAVSVYIHFSQILKWSCTMQCCEYMLCEHVCLFKIKPTVHVATRLSTLEVLVFKSVWAFMHQAVLAAVVSHDICSQTVCCVCMRTQTYTQMFLAMLFQSSELKLYHSNFLSVYVCFLLLMQCRTPFYMRTGLRLSPIMARKEPTIIPRHSSYSITDTQTAKWMMIPALCQSLYSSCISSR